jgi:hypothetical protein
MPAITKGTELLRPQDTGWTTRYFDSMSISSIGMLLPAIETGSWKECIVELTIAGSAIVSFMESNNGTSWTSVNSTLNLSTGSQGGTANTTGKYSVPLAAKFLSVQVTTWSSGAVSMSALFNLTQTILFQQINPQRNQLTTPSQVVLSTTTETAIIPASGSGFYNDIGWMLLTNTSATATHVDIRSTTGGAIITSVDLPASQTIHLHFDSVPLIQIAPNTVWTAQLSIAVTDVRITAGASKNTI